MESVACNCCGGRDLVVIYRQPDPLFFPHDWFDVVECQGCGLGFVNPRPTPNEIGKYYPPQFFEVFDDRLRHDRRYREEGRLLPPVVPGAPPPRLLDVGCADGDFPRYMRTLGWEVEGVEISANAQAIEDFPVYRTTLDRIPIDGARFDAVTAWAVLEHVHDPAAYFRAVGRILKPGGTFVFLVTNFESLSSRALFREDPPRHLYFFTEPTVKRFLTGAGLELRRTMHSNAIYEMLPANSLYYLVSRMVRRRPLRWTDLPESRHDYCRRRGIAPGLAGTLRYALAHPLAVPDRVMALVLEQAQLFMKRYGVVTYIATRPGRSDA